MTVRKLILNLLLMPFKAKVRMIWDSDSRSDVDYIWIDRNGVVQLCDDYESHIPDEQRPSWAPTEDENFNWGPHQANRHKILFDHRHDIDETYSNYAQKEEPYFLFGNDTWIEP